MFEPAVNRTVPAPEDQLRVTKLLFGVSAEVFVRIPKSHLVERDPKLGTGVSTEMLIREKEHFVELLEIDVEKRNGIRRRADDTFVSTAERLDRGGRVHVRDRSDALLEHTDVTELFPRVLDLIDRCHVRHRTSGTEVGQDHAL
jgi:hypothetical protein